MDGPSIDRTRLPIVAQMRDAALGVSHKASDGYNELHRECIKILSEMDTLKAQSVMSHGAADQKAAKLRDLQKRHAAVLVDLATAKAVQDEAQERTQSAAHLYNSCASFLGVKS